MGLDAILKRSFPAVIGALLCLAAYFQASGIGQVLASSIAVSPPALQGALTPRAAAGPLAGREHADSAEPILSRNPFDSVTGPLNLPPSVSPDRTKIAPSGDPYADPPCDGARLLLVAQGDDPTWSFAAMTGEDGKAILRRQGDELGGQTVYHVGWDRVWLSSKDTRCQLRFGAGVPPAATPRAIVGTTEPTRPAGGLASKIASMIRKVSETEYSVDRGAIDLLLENQNELMRSVRITLPKQGDKGAGFRLAVVRPGSPLSMIGLQTGDQVSSINGLELTDTQKALEAYARLTSADRLTVSIVRNGKPMNIDLGIK